MPVNKERSAIVVMRVADVPPERRALVAGTIEGACSLCKEPVLVAPSSQVGIRLVCTHCIDRDKISEGATLAVLEGALKELEMLEPKAKRH